MLEILIIDDSGEECILAERVFRDHIKVLNPITIYQSGKAAISAMDDRAEKGIPFLLFLDLVMAPISGLDVLDYWNKSGFAENSAIVMVSGLNDLKAIHQGYKLGAKTFVLKPLRKEDFVEVFKVLADSIAIKEDSGGYVLKWIKGKAAI